MICYLQEILFKCEERQAESKSLSKNRPFNFLKGKKFHKAIYTNIRKKKTDFTAKTVTREVSK